MYSIREPAPPDNIFGYDSVICRLWADYELIITFFLDKSQILFGYHGGAGSLLGYNNIFHYSRFNCYYQIPVTKEDLHQLPWQQLCLPFLPYNLQPYKENSQKTLKHVLV